MSAHHAVSLSPRDVLHLLKDHPRHWIVPAVGFAVLAALFCLVRERTWEASQALILREQASAQTDRLGSFGDVNEMKTVQETLLELSRSKSVLQAALVAVGPPADAQSTAAWPDAEDIADLRESLKITPPNGAEFGKTEVFYLKVKQNDRQRAIDLAAALCGELQKSFQNLRAAKYVSVMQELERSEALAEANLQTATLKLADLEKQAGVDLAELRMLQSSTSATSDLRQKLVEVENEVRRFEAEKRGNEQLLDLLRHAQENPGRLVASPNSLLASQPALRRLKDGLVDAQLKTAELEGAMSAEHPLVQAAKSSQGEISAQLHQELAIAIEGVQVDLEMTADRVTTLKAQLAADQHRLERLAAMRADYSNRIAMAQNRTELLEAARADLAEARAQQAAAGNVSLISLIDTPDTGTKPVGPGNTLIVLAGFVGGLACGFGLVFLTIEPTRTTAPWAPSTGDLNPVRDLSFGDALRKLNRQPAWS